MAFTKIVGAGIQTTTDVTVRNVQAGIITATKFIGDISEATGAAAGLGTALSQVQSSPLNKIYFTNQVLSIGSTITVDPPDSSNIAYTQYAEIAVEQGYDLIVEDGDDLVPDILGLSTVTATPLSGAGGRVRADQFTNKAGTGAPTFPNGINVTGIASISNTKTLGSSPFLQSVVAVENIVYVEENITLTSPYATGSTLHTKNKIVSVNDTKILTVGANEEFIINPLQL